MTYAVNFSQYKGDSNGFKKPYTIAEKSYIIHTLPGGHLYFAFRQKIIRYLSFQHPGYTIPVSFFNVFALLIIFLNTFALFNCII